MEESLSSDKENDEREISGPNEMIMIVCRFLLEGESDSILCSLPLKAVRSRILRLIIELYGNDELNERRRSCEHCENSF